jgi:hypothetical protein
MHERAHRILPTLALLALSIAASACTKPEGQTSGTAPSASASAAATPSATASTIAVAAADAAPSAEPAASASASAAPAASGSANAAASGSPSAASSGPNPLAAANAACGTKPLPDCPLQAWMKSNTNPAIASSDFPALATALDKTATFAPPGYTNWVSIAKDGAKAARASDMTATKASCRTCHDQYKTKYKADLRGRKI